MQSEINSTRLYDWFTRASASSSIIFLSSGFSNDLERHQPLGGIRLAVSQFGRFLDEICRLYFFFTGACLGVHVGTCVKRARVCAHRHKERACVQAQWDANGRWQHRGLSLSLSRHRLPTGLEVEVHGLFGAIRNDLFLKLIVPESHPASS